MPLLFVFFFFFLCVNTERNLFRSFDESRAASSSELAACAALRGRAQRAASANAGIAH